MIWITILLDWFVVSGFVCVQGGDYEISDSEKRDLKRMKTLERKARMSEIQRFHKAQVSKISLCCVGCFS